MIINLPNEEDIQDKNDLIEAINPVITHKDGTQVFTEGCLSVPFITKKVTRAQKVWCSYTDEEGNKKEIAQNSLLFRIQ